MSARAAGERANSTQLRRPRDGLRDLGGLSVRAMWGNPRLQKEARPRCQIDLEADLAAPRHEPEPGSGSGTRQLADPRRPKKSTLGTGNFVEGRPGGTQVRYR